MLRITKIAILILFIMVAFGVSYAQKPDTAKTEEKTDIKVLEERVKNSKNVMDDKFQELNVRMLIYVSFVISIMGLIGFLANFFGRKAIIGWIKERIKEDVNSITDHELEDAWREGFQKFIENKVIESEQILEKALKERLGKFEKDREDYIQLENEMNEMLYTFAKNKLLEMKEVFAKKEPLPKESVEKLAKFEEKLESVKEEKEYSAQDWHIKGYKEAEKGNYETAIEFYTRSINLNPESANAYINRGLLYYSLERYEMAIHDYDKANELNPDYAIPYYNRGLIFHIQKKYNKSINDYDKAIMLNPENIMLYQNQITLKIITYEYKAALNLLEKALELKPESSIEAALIYFKCIVFRILNKETINIEKEYDEILKRDFSHLWSFVDIEEWLAKADLSEDTKKFIQEKTELLKKKRK